MWGGESLKDGVEIVSELKILAPVMCQFLESDEELFGVGGFTTTLRNMTIHF